MSTTELIGYYSSLQGDRSIVNEDNSVIVFGNKLRAVRICDIILACLSC
jgi:hypothetical protein